MNDAKFKKEMWSLVLPITMQSFMLALVSATDAIMLGLLDQTSLSSVSLAGQVMFVFSLMIGGITVGLSLMMAQYWGKGDISVIERVIPLSLRMNLIFGLLFTLATFFIPEGIMALLTGEEALIVAGGRYLRTVSLSYLLTGISQIYLSVYKNINLAKESSIISSLAVVINIVFDAILIFGFFGLPALGIEGAAIATVLARVIELLMALMIVKKGSVKFKWSKIFDNFGKLESNFWYYTWPVLTAYLVWGIAFTLYSVIMGHLGSDAVAAHSIASIAKQLISCLIKGMGSATGIFIGNLLGANLLDEAKKYATKLLQYAFVVGLVTGLLLALCAKPICSLVTMSDTAKDYLFWMIIICGFNLIGQSVNIVMLDGIFTAGGDSRFDMIGNLFAMWMFSVPVGFLAAFVFKWPVVVVFLIVSLDEYVKMPAVFKRYRRYIWLNNITNDNI